VGDSTAIVSGVVALAAWVGMLAWIAIGLGSAYLEHRRNARSWADARAINDRHERQQRGAR
jgi:hypothetical protein